MPERPPQLHLARALLHLVRGRTARIGYANRVLQVHAVLVREEAMSPLKLAAIAALGTSQL
jgi:hypothetical protein